MDATAGDKAAPAPADHTTILLVSRSGTQTMSMVLGTTAKLLLRDDEERTCPIQMEEFDSPTVASSLEDFLPPGSCFVEGCPQLCVGMLLPCGHKFSPLAIVYHMCISGMQCPVCRY